MMDSVNVDHLPAWIHPLVEQHEQVDARTLSRIPDPPSDARPAAVLLLFADGPEGPELLLTRRGKGMRNHAGQISFPGGRSDPDDSGPAATALREAAEEVGLDGSAVTVIGELPALWLPPSNFAVTPVTAYWHDHTELSSTSAYEVNEVLHQPIAALVDPRNRFSVTHPSGWIGPAFDVGLDVPLWGFTAGVISRLFDVVGWSEPWDESDHRELPDEVFH